MARPRGAILAVAILAVAGCQRKAPAPRISGRVDPVVERVDGQPIYRSDVEREARAQGLDPLASGPGTTAYGAVLDELTDRKLLAQEAAREGLDQSADGRRRLDAARDRVLSNLILENRMNGAATEARVNGLYAEMVRARGPNAPAESLDQARPRIVRFLTFDRVKDLVLDLRRRAKITPPPPAAASTATPLSANGHP